MEQPNDLAGFVADGAEGEGEEGLLQIAQAVEEHAPVFEEGQGSR